MSCFEVVLCGTNGPPALDLASHRTPLPDLQGLAFTLLNGHVHMIGVGVRMTNLAGIKVSNVDFAHFPPTPTDSTLLELDGCTSAIISGNTFASQQNYNANENGILLSNTTNTRVSGNIFSSLRPTQAGGCIAALNDGTSTVRVTDNIFDNVKSAYNNLIGTGPTGFYYDTDNIQK